MNGLAIQFIDFTGKVGYNEIKVGLLGTAISKFYKLTSSHFIKFNAKQIRLLSVHHADNHHHHNHYHRRRRLRRRRRRRRRRHHHHHHNHHQYAIIFFTIR